MGSSDDSKNKQDFDRSKANRTAHPPPIKMVSGKYEGRDTQGL